VAKPATKWANGTSSGYNPITHSFTFDVKYHFWIRLDFIPPAIFDPA